MNPSREWLEVWKEARNILRNPGLGEYFTAREIMGKSLDRMPIGTVSLPTGNIVVRDPLCYLAPNAAPYMLTVRPGAYPVDLSVIVPDESGDCARYAAARVRFSDHEPILYEEALVGNEDLSDVAEGEYFGFGVDAGLACFCDVETCEMFCTFRDRWQEKNPGGNIYDDYFAALMEKNYQERPQYQRSGGDWLNWKIPGTDYNIPIFQSGFGDGAYPVYWGMDAERNICSLIVHFINIPIEFGEDDDEA